MTPRAAERPAPAHVSRSPARATARTPGTKPWALSSALTPTDRLTLGYLAGLAAIAAVYHPRPLPLIAVIASFGCALAALIRWGTRSARGRVAHDFFPIATVIAVFMLIGPLVAVANPMRWDATFASIDRRLFGDLPQAWFTFLGRPWWLTDAASVAYVSYYFVPVAMAVALYAADRDEDFERFVFTVMTAFLVSFSCYFLAPTSGPRVPANAASEVLGGGTVSAFVRAFIRHAEGNELDAFPSGHTTMSLVFLALGWRLLPRWRAPLALVTAGVVFSTVYLSFHYVVDLVAGVALAAALCVIVPTVRRLLTPP